MGAAGLGLPSTVLVRGLAQLYGSGPRFGTFLDGHLATMRASSNATIECTGRVLEGCKAGFGIGYVAPVIVIAAGQVILGHTFHAAVTVGTAVTFTNPVAMTCAAVGAVLYGFAALSPDERAALLETVAAGLKVGAELVVAVLGSAIEKLRALLSSEHLGELKAYLKAALEEVGRHLGDVTRILKDRLYDIAARGASGTVHLAHQGLALASAGAGTVAEQSSALAGMVARSAQETYEAARHSARRTDAPLPPQSDDPGN